MPPAGSTRHFGTPGHCSRLEGDQVNYGCFHILKLANAHCGKLVYSLAIVVWPASVCFINKQDTIGTQIQFFCLQKCCFTPSTVQLFNHSFGMSCWLQRCTLGETLLFLQYYFNLAPVDIYCHPFDKVYIINNWIELYCWIHWHSLSSFVLWATFFLHLRSSFSGSESTQLLMF
jgi:hypothetical protein